MHDEIRRPACPLPLPPPCPPRPPCPAPRHRSGRTLAEDLQRRAIRYNLLQVFLVAVLVPGTILLWIVSFLLIHFFIDSILGIGDCQWPLVSLCGSCLGLVGLAVWGYLNRRAEFDPESFENSEFSDFGPARGTYLVYDSRPAYVLCCILLAAPKTSILAIRAMRSWVWCGYDVTNQAAGILTELGMRPSWTPATDFAHQRPGLWLLDRLGLIWTRIEHGDKFIRIPPGTKRSDFA